MQIMRDDTKNSRPPRPVDSDTARSRQQLIGRKLRDMYDSVLDEGVPDDFEKLLSALDRTEAESEPEDDPAERRGEGVSDG